MVRYNYNRQVDPPAPYVYVILGRVDGEGDQFELPALVDSGADRTVIPVFIAEELSLEQSGTFAAAGLGSALQRLQSYFVQLGIRDLSPRPTEVVAITGEDYVILGRDVLNRYRVILDGPGLACVIE
jgi:hypothetical protein